MRLIPLSNKAKKLLSQRMSNNNEVLLVKKESNKCLFSTQDGKFCLWVNVSSDPDWDVALG